MKGQKIETNIMSTQTILQKDPLRNLNRIAGIGTQAHRFKTIQY